ncbi:hypothetical protein OUZ56_001809 [Daphnia magna]|uniref:Uncharacterized protein n=1 Tax=Daphnia magna TaxID=35525 RepID=A0ABR0A3S5_9CRUS|nr:hypothetical protein OUZ56_001809 [Daphnia magna]
MRFIMLVEFNWVCKQRRLLSFHVFDVPEMQQIKGGPIPQAKTFYTKKKKRRKRHKLNGETRETAQQLGRQGFIAGLSGTGGREGM